MNSVWLLVAEIHLMPEAQGGKLADRVSNPDDQRLEDVET